jgi:hypothetical protein
VILAVQMSVLTEAKTAIKTIAAVHSRCRRWVKSGNAHNEPMMSAFTPLATFERTCRDVGLVPIGDIRRRIRSLRQHGRAERRTEAGRDIVDALANPMSRLIGSEIPTSTFA